MAALTLGVLSPGDMGHSVGAVLHQHGLPVLTCLVGRSERSRALAAAAGIEDVPSLAALVTKVDVLLSILVPAMALPVAEQVADALRTTQTDLLYVDCNAIAPRTAVAVGEAIAAAGGRFADVGIIGPPPRQPGTKFYASGPGAATFARLGDFGLDVRVLDGPVGQASGFKMCYGALTKGLHAIGAELLTAARLMGLDGQLLAEQRVSVPELIGWLERGTPTMPPKAYRWVGEMEEIATCFGDLGLTPQIFAGVADFYQMVAATAIGHETPEARDRNRNLTGVAAALAAAAKAE